MADKCSWRSRLASLVSIPLLLIIVQLAPCIPTVLPTKSQKTPTISPTWIVGDLGWGEGSGLVIDAITGQPIADATVRCEHSSYTSPSLCNRITKTDKDGNFVFADVFFHDTEGLTVS